LTKRQRQGWGFKMRGLPMKEIDEKEFKEFIKTEDVKEKDL
jgi:hypothetical protein